MSKKIAFVSSAIANKPLNGGNAWAVLNWVLGLRKIGFDVYFVEQISRESCVDANGAVCAFDTCQNRTYFQTIMEQFGLSDSAALIFEEGEQIEGLDLPNLLDRAEAADFLINITGHLHWEPVMRRLRRKVYLDLDPGFTQFWHGSGNTGPRLEGHDVYFTVGENIGTPKCLIPTGDIQWHPTRQPVVLEYWPVSGEGNRDRFTTVASWRGAYGPVEYEGKTYGLKVHEFRKFIDLPERVPQTFEIALDIHPAEGRDLELLHRHGWQLADPRVAAGDPEAFRRYVQTSGAEFSVAQGVYVETESGWFSDRTVRYLASGKPVLVQDTGFSHNYPVGDGLLAFRTQAEAISGAQRIAADYDGHCGAARALAEAFFESDKVLGALVETIDTAS